MNTLLSSLGLLVLVVGSALPGQCQSEPAIILAGQNLSPLEVSGFVQTPEAALPGAVVRVLGTPLMVVTDADGAFRLTLPAGMEAATVLCTYAGFEDEAVQVTRRRYRLNVEMAFPHLIETERGQKLKNYLRTADRQVQRDLRSVSGSYTSSN